jgi:RimJ/RimL family protein N-acetyltransferase
VTDALAHWTPARPPDGTTALAGARVRLEPLDAARHAAQLYAASHGEGADPRLWDYLPYGPFPDAAAYASWVERHQQGDDPRFYAIIDAAAGRAVGVASYMRIEPEHGVIEIGHIWFGAALQRTPAATEAIYLLARHAFDELGHRRLEWKCDAANTRSRAAAQRFGFTYEGTFRQHLVVKGRNRDSAWFSLLDGEWPAARAVFEAWLDPANFDADGVQRRRLQDLRG